MVTATSTKLLRLAAELDAEAERIAGLEAENARYHQKWLYADRAHALADQMCNEADDECDRLRAEVDHLRTLLAEQVDATTAEGWAKVGAEHQCHAVTAELCTARATIADLRAELATKTAVLEEARGALGLTERADLADVVGTVQATRCADTTGTDADPAFRAHAHHGKTGFDPSCPYCP